MSNIEYYRPPLAAYQSAILNSKARFTVCQAATKCGKTASHIVWMLEQGLALRGNQSGWWISPSYQQSKMAYDRMKSQINDRRAYTCNETNLTITLITGGKLVFKTGENIDTLYGENVYFFVFDEYSRAREEAWHAVRSTITATNGRGKFIGNVTGRNWGYRLAMKAKQGDDPNYEFFKITAYDAVRAGILSREEIEDAKRDLPDNVFRELYLAEASEDKSNPFGMDFIQKAVFPLSRMPSISYGIDLARKRDYTVITGLDKFGQVSYFERFKKDWRQTVETIISLPPGLITVDGTGVGDAIAESIAAVRETEIVVYTSRTKQILMEGLAYAIQKRDVTILDGPMKNELESFEFVYTRNGVYYSCPSGLNDDCVNSLALAVKSHRQAAAVGEFSVW